MSLAQSRKAAKSRAGCANKPATKMLGTPCSAMASEARHRLGGAASGQEAREVFQEKADGDSLRCPAREGGVALSLPAAQGRASREHSRCSILPFPQKPAHIHFLPRDIPTKPLPIKAITNTTLLFVIH